MSDERWNRLEDKIDRLDLRLDKIDKTLERNTISLEIHEKRTTLLEASLKETQAHTDEHLEEIEADLSPIRDHVKFIKTAAWLAVGLAGLAATLRSLGLF